MPHIALNAHLLSGASSYRSAGLHGYQYNLLTHLPQAAADLNYTVYLGAGRLPELPQMRAYHARLPTQNPLLRIFWEQAIAPQHLARLRPDVFHGLAFSLPVAWRGSSVVTIPDLSFIRYPEHLSISRRFYLNLFTRRAAQQARRVITISESMKAEIVELLGIRADKVDVTLPGVGEDFRPLPPGEVAAFREEKGLPERFILHVGTLEPRKNLLTLIAAYARLPQQKEVKLVLAGGKGWQIAPIFALIEALEIEERVILPGYIPHQELPFWYNAAEVFAYPSVYEGFGLPVPEAMACGTPVIVSDTTSLPEAAGPGGLLVSPVDIEAWTAALADLLDDPALQTTQAARGQQWAAAFTWERTAHQTINSYHQILGT